MERRQVSWIRLGAGSAALFAVVLAFLAGRVRSGSDPAQQRLVSATTPAPQSAPAPQQQLPADPGSSYGDPGSADPGSGGDPGFSDPSPPVTQAS